MVLSLNSYLTVRQAVRRAVQLNLCIVDYVILLCAVRRSYSSAIEVRHCRYITVGTTLQVRWFRYCRCCWCHLNITLQYRVQGERGGDDICAGWKGCEAGSQNCQLESEYCVRCERRLQYFMVLHLYLSTAGIVLVLGRYNMPSVV